MVWCSGISTIECAYDTEGNSCCRIKSRAFKPGSFDSMVNMVREGAQKGGSRAHIKHITDPICPSQAARGAIYPVHLLSPQSFLTDHRKRMDIKITVAHSSKRMLLFGVLPHELQYVT